MENEKDLAEIPAEVLAGIAIHPVRHMDEVISIALLGEEELTGKSFAASVLEQVAEETITAH